jgi:hypothetical protein
MLMQAKAELISKITYNLLSSVVGTKNYFDYIF